MNEVVRVARERQSMRGPFDTRRSIPEEDLRQVLEAAQWAPTPHNMQNFEIIVVDDKKLLDALAEIKTPVSQAFIQENYRLLSFSEEELQRRKVGILGTMFPEFMRNPKVKPSREELTSSSQGSLVRKNPVLLVVLYDPHRRAPASEGDFLGIIGLGCVMENIWLAASGLGISCHIVSSFNDDPAASKVKALLKIPKDRVIAFTCRLGYATRQGSGPRVRRDINEFTYWNRYGVTEKEGALK